MIAQLTSAYRGTKSYDAPKNGISVNMLNSLMKTPFLSFQS